MLFQIERETTFSGNLELKRPPSHLPCRFLKTFKKFWAKSTSNLLCVFNTYFRCSYYFDFVTKKGKKKIFSFLVNAKSTIFMRCQKSSFAEITLSCSTRFQNMISRVAHHTTFLDFIQGHI